MKNIFSLDILSKFIEILSYLKFVFLAISLFFLLGAIFFVIKSTWLKRRFLEAIIEFGTYRPFGVKKTFKQWIKITKKLETNKEADYKLAVIEADGLLDNVLEKMGYKGETTADRLKQLTSDILPDLDKIQEVHKIRNNIVHDPDYQFTLDDAKKVVATYEKAFRDLEVF